MRTSDLPSPGRLRISQKLRVLSAQALGALDIRKDNGGSDVDGLGAFFRACAEKAGAVVAGAAQVVNGAAANVKNSAGSKTVAGTAAVTSGTLTQINLPETAALLVSGDKINAGTVTGTGNFATVTIANGVITGIVLSAS